MAPITELAFERLEGSGGCLWRSRHLQFARTRLIVLASCEKLANVRSTSASILATGNAGCQMQIGAGASWPE